MPTAILSELLSLAGTLLLAYPPTRLSFRLLQMRNLRRITSDEDVPEEIKKAHKEWEEIGVDLLQKWNSTDHWCLCVGICFILGATVIRLFQAL